MAELRRMGVRLTAEGVNQYKEDLRSAGREAREMSQETRLAMLELGNNASEADKFTTKLKGLERQYEVQRNKLKTLTNAQKEYSTSLNLVEREISDTTNELRQSQRATNSLEKEYRDLGRAAGYNANETKEAKRAWEASKNETKELSRSLNRLEKEQKQYTRELDKMPNKLNKTEIEMAQLSNEMEKLNRQYARSGGRFTDFSNQMDKAAGGIRRFSDGVTEVGHGLTEYMTVPLIGMGVAAATVGVRFEKQMNRVSAISQATGSEFEQLRQQAIDLGESTVFGATEVAQAQEELASQGFEVNEILAAMPGLLDLASVSGGDMALAAQAAGTAVNQFGLEMSDTAHVADVYAKAAADTNAETQDMAQAMSYVGPVASDLGTSFEEAAAAIGIMSDAGITGTKAGTALRTMLLRLAAPTGKAGDAMADLGLEVYDAEGQMKPLSELLPHLNERLSGLSEESRNAALNTIFGKESMSGVSALLKEADGGFQDLTTSLVESDGAAQEFAETINSGLAGTIEEMMGSLETAGIEITEALAPAITDLAKGITDVVQSFNELDDSTQQTILKFLAFAAATGPVLSMIGRMGQGVEILTKLGSGAIRMFGRFEASTSLAGQAALSSADDVAGLGAAAATAGGAKGLGGFTAALSGALPWITGIGLAVGAGYGAWKLWGEGVWESAQRTKRWGSDVGEATDEALTSIENYSQNAVGQFGLVEEGLNGSVDSMVGNFEKMGQAIEQDVNRQIEALGEAVNMLPEEFQAAGQKVVEETQTAQQEALSVVRENNQKMTEIRQNAANNNREITAAEGEQIRSLMQESASAYLEITIDDAEQRKQVMESMTGDVENASREQAETWLKNLGKQRQNTKQHYSQQLKDFKRYLKEQGILGTEAGDQLVELFEESKDASTDAIDQQIAMIAEKYPELADEIFFANGQMIDAMGEAGDAAKQSNQEIIRNAQEMSGKLAESAEKNAEQISWVADEALTGAETWNGIILDEKTGEVKSNVREEVINASESADTWNHIRFQLKNADLNSNAKSIIGEAAITHGYWGDMSWEEKQAVLQDEFTQTIYKSLEESGRWNEMSLEEKTAIMYSNTPEKMTETLAYLGLWDEYEADIKEINAENYGFINTIRQSEELMNIWRNIDPDTKELLGENYDLMTKIFESETRLNAFKAIPDEHKELMANNLDLLNKVTQSEEALNRWNGLPEDDKRLVANNTQALGSILTSEEIYKRWLNLPVQEKRILGNNFDLLNSVLSSEQRYNEWLALPNSEKFMRATASTNAPFIQSQIDRASQSADNLNEKNPNVITSTNALTTKGNFDLTTFSARTLNNQNPNVPTSTNALNTKGKLDSATGSAQDLNNQGPHVPTSTNASSTEAALDLATGSAIRLENKSPHTPTSTNARTTQGALERATGAADDLDSRSPDIIGSTNAPTLQQQINNARNAAQNKKFTITGVFRKVGDWLNPFNATGNPSFEGGPTWLGDGGKREPYLTPRGDFGVSGSSDELHTLPRGTRIWPSRQSFKTSARYNDGLKQYLDNIPKFATGGTIENPYDGYTGLVGEAGPEIFQIAQGKVSITPISENQRSKVLDQHSGEGESNAELITLMREQLEYSKNLADIVSLLAQGQVIQMDGKEVGRSIYDEVDTIMNQNFRRGNIMNMKK